MKLLDQLRAEGQLDGLIESLCRFSETIRVIEASRSPDIDSCSAKLWGPALVFGRLWERQGIAGILEHWIENRCLEFDLERVSFALSLQRLMEPGSDLQGSHWVRLDLKRSSFRIFTVGLIFFRIFGSRWRGSFTSPRCDSRR